MEIGSRIRKYRKLRGLTQKELAEKVEISKSFMSFIESEKNKPSLENLNKIAKVLNVSVDVLVGNAREPVDPVIDLMETANFLNISSDELVIYKDKDFVVISSTRAIKEGFEDRIKCDLFMDTKEV